MKNPIFACAMILTLHAHAADSISVNFHVGNDADHQADHVLTTGETAGYGAFATDKWNNINIGNGGTNASGTIFPDTALTDASGNTGVATLSTSAQSSWFTGYASGSASTAAELDLPGKDDELFNSYLGLNGPGGDESPADSAVLVVSGLGNEYTNNGYSLIIYSDSDKTSSSSTRQSSFKLTPNGGAPTTLSTDDNSTFSSTYDNDGSDGYSNFVVFENISTTGFTLEVTSPGSGGRGAISGFQIVPNGAVSSLAINSFSVNDGYVGAGETASLSWNTTSATSLTIDPGNINVTGTTSLSISPTATTTYTLSASDGTDSITADLEVVAGPARPNIIIFLVDDMGITDTSVPFAYDGSGQLKEYEFNKFYKTDAMKTLAAEGMKFTQAYATPVCSSTRTSLMTGYNTTRHGVISQVPSSGNDPVQVSPVTSSHDPPNNWKRTGVQADDVMMPAILKGGNYRTIHAGKGHFGSTGSYAQYPTAFGFDINRGGDESGSHSYTSYGDLPNMAEYNTAGDFLSLGLTKAMNAEIADAVSDGVPFFAYMSHYGVHSPFTTDPNATFAYNGNDGNGALAGVSTNHKKFATMMEGVDQSLGQIMAKLVELGVEEETLIIFMGDNGSDSPATNDNGFAEGGFSDFPMRGKKATAWEGGIRVPMIVSWAKSAPTNPIQANLNIPKGSVERDLVVVWDILPTLLNVSGITPPHAFDGYDISPYLRGTEGTHRPQEMLMYLPIDHRNDYFSIYRQGDWKLIYFFATNTFSLYHLGTDPTESNNVASANPERVMSMARAMAKEFERTWGIRGRLWPTFDSDSSDDPFSMPSLPGVDIDMDGLADNSEDPNSNGLVDSGETSPELSDSDFDGSPDGLELGTGSDPLDGSSSFVMEIAVTAPGAFDVTWPSIPGRTFLVEGSDDLDVWEDLDENYPAAATGSVTSLSVELPEDTGKYFIRITVNP